MQGMFRANGGCGYVRKPDFLLKSGPHGEVFDPKVKLPVKKTLKVASYLKLIGLLIEKFFHFHKITFSFNVVQVTVYMGEGWYYDFKSTHFDQYSPPDFYVRVSVAHLYNLFVKK